MTPQWIFPLKLPPAAEQFAANIWLRPLIASGSGLAVKSLRFLNKTAKLFTWEVKHFIWRSNEPEMLERRSFRALVTKSKSYERVCQFDVTCSCRINEWLIVGVNTAEWVIFTLRLTIFQMAQTAFKIVGCFFLTFHTVVTFKSNASLEGGRKITPNQQTMGYVWKK